MSDRKNKIKTTDFHSADNLAPADNSLPRRHGRLTITVDLKENDILPSRKKQIFYLEFIPMNIGTSTGKKKKENNTINHTFERYLFL